MAKYNVNFDVSEDTVVKVLTFCNRDYSEFMKENGVELITPSITAQINHDYPDIPDYLLSYLDELTDAFVESSEIMTYMHEIQEYESTVLSKSENK